MWGLARAVGHRSAALQAGFGGLRSPLYRSAATAAQPAPAAPRKGEQDAELLDMTPSKLRPKQIVELLDKFIIGQTGAKRAIAIAVRNRWRRHHVRPNVKDEVNPKNILMVGPTGVGKTEIARRLAKLTDAPFVKVEATKFTEVGFVGRDVDSIIDDLFRASLAFVRQRLRDLHRDRIRQLAEDRVLTALSGSATDDMRQQLRDGKLDGLDVRIPILVTADDEAPPQGDNPQILRMLGQLQKNRTTQERTLKIPEALKEAERLEMSQLIDEEKLVELAIQMAEQNGIVFIDEIDKIVVQNNAYHGSGSASDEGVQQDLLPLIEGTTVTTKAGHHIKTDKILFICSGAFHNVKPSDMLAELQGRLPIRVTLEPLTRKDFYRILTEPVHNLLRQHTAMFKAEGVALEFDEDAIREMADVAFRANALVQNIGARRLLTVTERVLEELSFHAPDYRGQKVSITKERVQQSVGELLKGEDLSRLVI